MEVGMSDEIPSESLIAARREIEKLNAQLDVVTEMYDRVHAERDRFKEITEIAKRLRPSVDCNDPYLKEDCQAFDQKISQITKGNVSTRETDPDYDAKVTRGDFEKPPASATPFEQPKMQQIGRTDA